MLAGVILGGEPAYSVFQIRASVLLGACYYFNPTVTTFFFLSSSIIKYESIKLPDGTDMQNNLRLAYAMMETERKQKAMMEIEVRQKSTLVY